MKIRFHTKENMELAEIALQLGAQMSMQTDPTTGMPTYEPPIGPPARGFDPPPAAPAPPAPPVPPMMTLDEAMALVEKARKEEKEKLYPQLNETREAVAILTREREDRIAADERARQEAEEVARRKLEDEMSSKQLIEEVRTDYETKFQEMQRNLETERAIREKEAQFHALENYRTRRLAEESKTIEPRLLDFVRGNNETEIEASIQMVQSKTSEIVAETEALLGLQQQQQQPPPPPPAVPITGMPSADLSDLAGGGRQSYTPEQLAAIPLSDWGSVRGQFLAAASEKVRTEGLYSR